MQSHETKELEAVFAKVLPKIKPSENEQRKNFEAARHIIGKLESEVPPSVKVVLAGSLAKGTNLSGKNEFDIFLLFPRSFSHHEMAMLGLHYARKALRGMRLESRYAEHPYLTAYHGSFHADVVPAYRISGINEKGSSVDRSALHTEYINAKLNAKQKNGVRLLKRFLKNFGVYGAELRVEGFSGYLCELLVAHYGSFISLLEAAADWHDPVVDGEGHHKEGHRKMFSSPLVVIDPVDPHRNVAAVVAQTSLSRFVLEARRFLRQPSEKFFFSQKAVRSIPQIKNAMKARGTVFYAISFPAPQVVPDVLWPQLKKTAQSLVKRLQSLEFSVFDYYHWSDGNECVVLLELDRWELPIVRKAVGPQVHFASDVTAFVKKHASAANIHLEHDRVVAVEKREFVDAGRAIFSACRRTDGLGMPENMRKTIAHGKISEGVTIVKPKYAEFLSDHLFAKIA